MKCNLDTSVVCTYRLTMKTANKAGITADFCTGVILTTFAGNLAALPHLLLVKFWILFSETKASVVGSFFETYQPLCHTFAFDKLIDGETRGFSDAKPLDSGRFYNRLCLMWSKAL